MGRDVLPGGPPESLTEQRAEIVVFACGDPAHGEHDSIAIAACTGLPPATLERIDLKLVGPLRPEYLRDLAPDTLVIIADTVPGTPGEIVELPFLDLVGREASLVAHSTPDQALDEVVAMAELLRDEPLGGRFVGFGLAQPDLSAPPDEASVAVLREALERVLSEAGTP